MIDRSLAATPQHYCDPPEILSFEYDPTPPEHEFDIRPPTIHCDFPPGTRFFCDDCGAVLVSTFHKGGDNGRVGWAPYYDWQVETRQQRRQRLGVSWWAFWRSA